MDDTLIPDVRFNLSSIIYSSQKNLKLIIVIENNSNKDIILRRQCSELKIHGFTYGWRKERTKQYKADFYIIDKSYPAAIESWDSNSEWVNIINAHDKKWICISSQFEMTKKDDLLQKLGPGAMMDVSVAFIEIYESKEREIAMEHENGRILVSK